MIKKTVTKTGNCSRVTFKYPNKEGAAAAALAGEFNNWSMDENPMKRLKDGSFSVTVSLESGRSYRYRYVLDGGVWVNDPDADKYVSNDYGTDDSVVVA